MGIVCTNGVQVKFSRQLSQETGLWIDESILEPEIKVQIDAATYEAEVGLAEMVLDVEEIAKATREVRGD